MQKWPIILQHSSVDWRKNCDYNSFLYWGQSENKLYLCNLPFYLCLLSVCGGKVVLFVTLYFRFSNFVLVTCKYQVILELSIFFFINLFFVFSLQIIFGGQNVK